MSSIARICIHLRSPIYNNQHNNTFNILKIFNNTRNEKLPIVVSVHSVHVRNTHERDRPHEHDYVDQTGRAKEQEEIAHSCVKEQEEHLPGEGRWDVFS